MKLQCVVVFFASVSLSVSYEHRRMIPRLIHPNSGGWSYPLPREERNAVFYLSPQNSLYIGGEEIVYHFDFKTMKNYTIEAQSYNCQVKPYCKNYVTFVGQLRGSLIVCGTNAYSPGCWQMDDDKFKKLDFPWMERLAPRVPGTNYNILITGNETYSTLPQRSNNAVSTMIPIFRKIYGAAPLLYTGNNLMRSPHFVKSLVVEREDRGQDKIFLFFMEDNSQGRTTEKKVSMMAQLCKEESGSVKASTRFEFSTALKSRLVCGNQLSGQYYPHLQDVYFLQGKTEDVIYGLFTNAWNHSAVCSYKIEDIEHVFNTSDLLGSSKKDLKIRPGMCLPKPRLTPEETSNEAQSFPELTEWVWSSGKKVVLQTLTHYTKIAVDEIKTVRQNIQRVILLATDNGMVHKVVELDNGILNILELHPFNQSGTILQMELAPKEHVLYLVTAREISRLPLDDCTAYNSSCTECNDLSQDPYCVWIKGKCQSILKSQRFGLLNIPQEVTCELGSTSFQKVNSKGDRLTSSDDANLQPNSMYYLTCPAASKHADYSWRNGEKEMGSGMLHHDTNYLLFDKVTFPGEYQCIAQEMETEHVISKYKFVVSNKAARIQYSLYMGWTMLVLLLTLHYS